MAAAAVGVGAYYYRQFDDELRARIEAKLATHYDPLGWRVDVRSAQYVAGEGIVLRGVTLTPRSGPREPTFAAEQMILGCTLSPENLLEGDVPIERISLVRPVLHAVRGTDGSWNVQSLWPLPKFSKYERRPPIHIDDATLVIDDARRATPVRQTLRHVQCKLTTVVATESGSQAPAHTQIEATFAGDHFRRGELRGEIHARSGTLNLAGNVDGLGLCPELLSLAGVEVPPAYAPLCSLRGDTRVEFQVQRVAGQPLAFDVRGKLQGGTLADRRWPESWHDIALEFHCNQHELRIERLSARAGQATLVAALQRSGWQPGSPLEVEAQIRGLTLDQRWRDVLPEAAQYWWNKYDATGKLDADVTLTFDGQTWRPAITARCEDATFAYHKFRYRMRQASGSLRWVDDVFELDLLAYAGQRPVSITSRIEHPGPRYSGWVEVRAEQAELDDELVAALPEKAADVVRSLQPRGKFDYVGRFERRDPTAPTMDQQMTFTVQDAAIRYQKFPLLIEHLRGVLRLDRGRWTFDDVQAGNLRAFGSLTPLLVNQQPTGYDFMLHVTAADVPLEEPLRQALPPKMQQVWSDLQPRGTLDRVDAVVQYITSTKKLDLEVTARKQPPPRGAAVATAGALSIVPSWFQYRIDDLTGAATYRDGQLVLHHLAGRHGRSQVTTKGQVQHDHDGGFVVKLEGLHAEQLAVDRELLDALPEKLRAALGCLQVSRPIDFRGNLTFARAGRQQPLLSRWDVAVGLQQNALDAGVALENMHGTIRLVGAFDPRRGCECLGDLALDAATYKQMQFTKIRGPIEIQDGQILFGGRARRLDGNATPAPIAAQLFDGSVVGDCVVTLGPQPQFNMQAQWSNGDLAQYAREMIPGQKQLRGRITATTQLQGVCRNPHTIRGGGKLRVREADVYELPVMVALLKMLRVKEPSTTAFTDGDVDYRVQGDHIYLDRIKFHGDAISLVGNGELNLDRQVKLNFYAMVGRDDMRVPLIRPLLAAAAKQMMEIRVDGPLDNPRVTPEAFPGAKQFLQQLQDDLASATDPQDVLAPVREVLRTRDTPRR